MNLQTLLTGLIKFLNESIVPALIALAFLFFIWNAARYFIIGGSNEDAQEKARSFALWSIIARPPVTRRLLPSLDRKSVV